FQADVGEHCQRSRRDTHQLHSIGHAASARQLADAGVVWRRYVLFPPLLMHAARNVFRSLPRRSFWLAWSEHVLEIAFFSSASILAGGEAGACAKAVEPSRKDRQVAAIRVFITLSLGLNTREL